MRPGNIDRGWTPTRPEPQGSRSVKPELSLNGRSRANFVGFRGRERASAFFKRGREVEYIRRGMRFRRVKSDNSIETAHVLSVVLDRVQIPHVRFELKFQHSARTAGIVDGPRMLALSVFANTYRESVGRR